MDCRCVFVGYSRGTVCVAAVIVTGIFVVVVAWLYGATVENVYIVGEV